MIALYIAAASIVAVAVALLVARTPAKLRTADQRGITLQTLIVTAVLVLMAGAAGVVIIAITNNAQDNLQGQDASIDSRCEPWEVFDPTLDAAGRGGGQGGIGSSASGCVRVCYIGQKADGPAIGAVATESTASAVDDIGGNLELRMSRSDIASRTNAASATTVLVVTGNNALAVKNTMETATVAVELDDLDINPSSPSTATTDNYDPDNMMIEVAPNGRYCQIWNTTDDELIIRSS